MHTSIRKAVYALAVALMLPATFAVAESSAQNQLRKDAVQLTRHIEASAREIHTDADRLDSLRRDHRISNKSHAAALHKIAVEVNEDLGPSLQRLALMQQQLPGWHQDAVEEMRVSAANLAAHASAASVNRGNDGTRKAPALDQEYGKLIAGLNQHAGRLVELADASGDYAQAQLKGNRAGLAIVTHD